MRSSLAGWSAVSIAAGIGSLLVLRQPVTLADPSTCANLFDLIAIVAARTWRDAALGSMLAMANAAVLVLALLCLARAVYRITAAVGVTLAITVAASVSPVFAVALAPSQAAQVLAVIAAWACVLRANARRHEPAALVVAVALLATLAATAPPLTLPAALVGAWLAWRHRTSAPSALRLTRVVVTMGAVVAGALLMQMVVPREMSCVLPARGVTAIGGATWALADVVAQSPLAGALAMLGLLSMSRLAPGIAWSLMALAVASFSGAIIEPTPQPGTMAAFVVAFWLLAATGLRDVWEAVRHTTGGRVGAVALSLTLVVLQMLHVTTRDPKGRMPDGHERLTTSAMGTLVGEMPRGAALVEEDAATDLLLRALPGRLRSADRLHIVARDSAAVAAGMAAGRVFALPRSQRVLQHLGLELMHVGRDGATGLAEVRQAHACTPTLTERPSPLPQLDGHTQLALVAGDELSRGPVVILLPAAMALSMLPLDWPPAATRGFHGRTFDLTRPDDVRDLGDELRTYGLPPYTQPPPSRFVSRIEAWRTPGAPLVLPVSLGGATGTGTARLLTATPGQHLRLCPSFPFDVQPLVRRR